MKLLRRMMMVGGVLRFDDIVVVEIGFLVTLWRHCDYFAVILQVILFGAEI